MKISIIAAVAENGVIGQNNQLVWELPVDMNFFMKTTQEHCILTGRRNYESIPKNFRPLKNRTNIVITSQQNYSVDHGEVKVVHSVEEGINLAVKLDEKELFIIGGGQIYEQTIKQADRLYLTEVKHQFEGDTFFPSFDRSEYQEISRIIHKPDHRHQYEMHFTVLEKQLQSEDSHRLGDT